MITTEVFDLLPADLKKKFLGLAVSFSVLSVKTVDCDKLTLKSIDVNALNNTPHAQDKELLLQLEMIQKHKSEIKTKGLIEAEWVGGNGFTLYKNINELLDQLQKPTALILKEGLTYDKMSHFPHKYEDIHLAIRKACRTNNEKLVEFCGFNLIGSFDFKNAFDRGLFWTENSVYPNAVLDYEGLELTFKIKEESSFIRNGNLIFYLEVTVSKIDSEETFTFDTIEFSQFDREVEKRLIDKARNKTFGINFF